ncbi:TPA: leucine--tRNA ligase, partial [Candidatus Woesearchaeota archaeon]|nr:leucine--tRNA ligase [Candidatus Woesearchaeota archaeon]
LEMFPYPSAYGLHMGHSRNYTMGDVIARYKRMQGFDVLYPMGYDAFGLPAENAAIKNKTHPKTYTDNAIASISKQQRELGSSYDWERMVVTCRPEYYKWNQWFFIQFYKRGLAYRKEAPINWCPKCATVLANEQVKDGKCWRCDSVVEPKNLEQWFLKITEYADVLLEGLSELQGWPEKIRIMQENWIGKSTGVDIHFKLEEHGKPGMVLPAFTTRCDTIFSVTFLAIAPEHPLIETLVKGSEHAQGAKEFCARMKRQSIIDRTNEEKEKEGFFTGRHAINPVNNERIPIYIANFAVMYGSGIVMCDAHDKRDFRFARKYDIPLKFVISPTGEPTDTKNHHDALTDDGILFGSGTFSGISNRDALPLMAEWLEKEGLGKRTYNYKIRDWLISRQRYWGTPIPMVYCDACGVVPVPEADLPVLLPEDVQFTGEGNPLKTSEAFVNTECPKCKAPARRETDTMDTFMDSSWYFLRYPSPNTMGEPFDSDIVNRALPVDQYIGGAEHAVMHLLYARFFTRVLHDMGLVKVKEPFTHLFNQGMVTKDGNKMSKSYGNVVAQDEIAQNYGIDTARLFLMFVSSPESELEWSDEGIQCAYRFLNKVYGLVEALETRQPKSDSRDALLESKRNVCIRDTTAHLDTFRLNKAVMSVMEFANTIIKYQDDVSPGQYRSCLDTLARLLLPFTPHIAEEMWARLGNETFLSLDAWPAADASRMDARAEAAAEFVEETISGVRRTLSAKKIDSPNRIELFMAESWKYDFVPAFKRLFATVKNPKEIADRLVKEVASADPAAITQLTFAVYKNMKLLPVVDMSRDDELPLLHEVIARLKDEFGCDVILTVDATSSSDSRAKNGLPGKPAISVV